MSVTQREIGSHPLEPSSPPDERRRLELQRAWVDRLFREELARKPGSGSIRRPEDESGSDRGLDMEAAFVRSGNCIDSVNVLTALPEADDLDAPRVDPSPSPPSPRSQPGGMFVLGALIGLMIGIMPLLLFDSRARIQATLWNLLILSATIAALSVVGRVIRSTARRAGGR